MNIAAALGDLDTIKLLHRAGLKYSSERILPNWIGFKRCTVMDMAAATGRLDIVEWLHTHRKVRCTTNAMTFAIARGHIGMVKWLLEVRRLYCTEDGLSTAASDVDDDMVSYY
ncbi:hypothetical protein THRCLA_22309 [Thraustotheca clavata]|uniref:Uncharacterized protein n=1 Tax=Thraustotheca clavata TaxID=74557 RepID=A0A1V9Z6C6_9STRA|nr:hypothetical protein THRCLA_22309 [Thraustotheca clavata]